MPEAKASSETSFYVSDSATIEVVPPKTIIPAGVFNSSKMYGPDADVFALFASGSLYVGITAPYEVPGQSINADVQFGLYRISDVENEKPELVDILSFKPPYGTAKNGLVMNGTTGGRNFQIPCAMEFRPYKPVVLGCRTPNKPGRYQVGAVYTFFCDHPFKSVQYVSEMSGELRSSFP